MRTKYFAALGLILAPLAQVSAQGTPAQQAPARETPRPGLIDEGELAALRGGETVIVNSQSLTGVNSGNSIGDYTAGSVTISDSALSNFNGVGNLVINTGAQNNLQAGMTLTVNLNP